MIKVWVSCLILVGCLYAFTWFFSKLHSLRKLNKELDEYDMGIELAIDNKIVVLFCGVGVVLILTIVYILNLIGFINL